MYPFKDKLLKMIEKQHQTEDQEKIDKRARLKEIRKKKMIGQLPVFSLLETVSIVLSQSKMLSKIKATRSQSPRSHMKVTLSHSSQCFLTYR